MDFQRYHHAVLLLLPLLIAPAAWAEADYAPQLCPARELQLRVENPTAEPLPFWLQVREDGRLTDELADEVPAGATVVRSGADFLAEGQAFSVRQRTSQLRFFLDCAGTTPMTAATSPRADYALGSLAAPLLVRVQNLHHSAQLVTLRFLGAGGRTLAEQTLPLSKSYVSTESKITAPPGAVRLQLEGEARLSSQVLRSEDLSLIAPLAPTPAEVHVPTAASYFLLTNDSSSESFVIAVDKADLADQARALIRQKSYKITFALAEAAPAAGENRDFLSAGAPSWSWRVKEVYGFNDLGHQECSGSPSLLEDRVVAGAERMICFWSFRLRRELTPDEVRTGRLVRP